MPPAAMVEVIERASRFLRPPGHDCAYSFFYFFSFISFIIFILIFFFLLVYAFFMTRVVAYLLDFPPYL